MKSSGLKLAQVSLDLGGFSLNDISLSVGAGEVLAVLGPNGAGKSVLMELIAGFYRPDTGRVCLDGQEIAHQAPEKRHIGFVFQNYALFPHLTVAQNVRFALGRRHRTGAAATQRITELLLRFGLPHLANRHPEELSGGEKQRAALARAMAREPKLFLFDEPFAAVDERSRGAMTDEIRQMLHETGVPAIFVMHDLVEALALADRLVIMQAGRLEQIGTVDEVLNRPANEFVARFVGMENILDGILEEIDVGGAAIVQVANRRLRAAMPCSPLQTGQRVKVCIRPESIECRQQSNSAQTNVEQAVGAPGDNVFLARIDSIRPSGPLMKVQFESPLPLLAYTLKQRRYEEPLAPGQRIALRLPEKDLHLIPCEDLDV